MAIFKITLSTVVLLEADTAEEAATLVAEAGLSGTAFEISEGEWIGSTSDGPAIEVPADKVADELIAIGNDGEFFA